MNYQILGEGKFLFIEVFHLINKERMIKFEFFYFTTPKKLINLGIDSLIPNAYYSDKKRNRYYVSPVDDHNTTYEVFLQRKQQRESEQALKSDHLFFTLAGSISSAGIVRESHSLCDIF